MNFAMKLRQLDAQLSAEGAWPLLVQFDDKHLTRTNENKPADLNEIQSNYLGAAVGDGQSRPCIVPSEFLAPKSTFRLHSMDGLPFLGKADFKVKGHGT